jgi:hypothetical protein
MIEIDSEVIMYPRRSQPFGKSWEKWVEDWCIWLLSIPKEKNPANDETGANSGQNQKDENVWFLAGSFGNNNPIRRRCTMPKSKAILFPIADKEDSFAEDQEFNKAEELSTRAKTCMDRLVYLDLIVDGKKVINLKKYRVCSHIFKLQFPNNNVYSVTPGQTTSVCEGYWAFLKPLPSGSHEISFSAGILSPQDDPVTIQMQNSPIHDSVIEEINKNAMFKIDVTYELKIM